ncbi:S8 family serine peptidase [Lysobacter sp. 5GHs7-4]|uniref:S8 family serine peptidase n=1 Tax=Lysobacter sp. 5GHs7-4 TaxID=2904253 RepID=UPI001E416163|nr:S8 family serine peptidase [Lysobacter sp. 5GHs7-4]UHQ24323.1 S8 family serine peptidase [Lysobacter sp. 5GHs7-4]
MMSASSKHLRLSALALAVALTAAAAPAFAGKAHIAGLRSGETYNAFIVKYKTGSAPRASATSMTASLDRLGAQPAFKLNGKALRLSHKRKTLFGADVVIADRGLDSAQAKQLLLDMAADRDVEWVQPDYMVRALATPNDTRFNEQWHYADSAVGINAPTAWNTSTGSGVVVAVIDSGILAHTDLDANILPGYDFISSTAPFSDFQCLISGLSAKCGGSNDGDGRDNNATDSSNIKHGTHVAGTIGAVTNNSAGVAGVAYGAKIVPVRALGNQGVGVTSDIADAIVWASGGTVAGVPANANPAEVINMSLGGDQACSATPAYQTAIDTANANGSIVVVAAGNSNIDVSGATPASCNGVVSVAASDQGGKRAWYSTYGAVSITAPGGETCSPATEFLALGESTAGKCTQNHAAKGVLSTYSGNGYEFNQGTSMATPHVAGVVALIQAVGTPKTLAQVKQILSDTARPIAAANCPGGCGPGLIDAAAAVAAAGGGTPGNNAPVANFSSSASGLTVSFTDSSSDSDGSIASRSWNFGDGTTSTATSPSKTYSAAGTYTVTLTVTDDDGATNTKTASVTVSSPSTVQTYSSTTDVNIPDNNATGVTSSIAVSGRSGNAPSNAKVSVNIQHTYQQDLIVDLIAPDGTVYNLWNRQGNSSNNVIITDKVVNLSSETLNGTWKLRAADRASIDTGYINSWSVTF